MPIDFLPVPANGDDCVREAVIDGFVFTEARHAPLMSLERHAHERATITVLLDGVFEESYRARKESCVQSSVLFRPAGEPHADHFGRTGGYNLVIEVDKERREAIQPYTNVLDSISHWRDVRLIAIARRIHSELMAADAAATLALEGLTLELLAVASRQHTAAIKHKSAPPRWLSNIRAMLHDRFNERLRIADLASQAEVHPVYLARVFREHYGRTPGAYLRRVRIDWAAQQLANSSARPIIEIALLAGFSDQSHFTHAFKREIGLTPAQFVRESVAKL
jgi:AraC family transcriptional regulator